MDFITIYIINHQHQKVSIEMPAATTAAYGAIRAAEMVCDPEIRHSLCTQDGKILNDNELMVNFTEQTLELVHVWEG